MTVYTWIDIVVFVAAVPATLFSVLYPILSPQWWRSWIGRALETSSIGLAALLDLSLLANWYSWRIPRWGLIVILGLIAAGAWLKFTALISLKARAYLMRKT